jgi:hypothetical protein
MIVVFPPIVSHISAKIRRQKITLAFVMKVMGIAKIRQGDELQQ